jgi:prepilin-type N-terminal cleavage/methylation domain-containing protein
MFLKRRNTERGFTLIEILIVITIVGIIIAIVIANLEAARSRSRDSKRISDISEVQLILAAYLNTYGTYPNSASSRLSSDAFPALVAGINSSKNTPHINSSISTDPTNTYPYVYYYFSNGSTYCLAAVLENQSAYVDQSLNGVTNGVDCSLDLSSQGIDKSRIYITKK